MSKTLGERIREIEEDFPNAVIHYMSEEDVQATAIDAEHDFDDVHRILKYECGINPPNDFYSLDSFITDSIEGNDNEEDDDE